MRRPPSLASLCAGLSLAVGLVACNSAHSADNARAKARIFSPEDDRTPTPPAIDVGALGSSPSAADAVFEMSEAELAQRVGSFRLRGKLGLRFEGPGQTVAIDEDRLVEQAKSGDLHLRALDGDGGGMEILWVDRKAYGRTRYGPFVLRDRLSGLSEQREDVFGVLATLYRAGDQGFALRDLGAGQGCERFALGLGTPRPLPPPPRFTGRLDPDTAKRAQFVYGRKLAQVSGELCVDPRGVVTHAHVVSRWTASGDAGSAAVRAEWTQSIVDIGADVRIAAPTNPEPEPHRPKGPFATLNKYGFVQKADGGEEQ